MVGLRNVSPLYLIMRKQRTVKYAELKLLLKPLISAIEVLGQYNVDPGKGVVNESDYPYFELVLTNAGGNREKLTIDFCTDGDLYVSIWNVRIDTNIACDIFSAICPVLHSFNEQMDSICNRDGILTEFRYSLY